MEINPWSRSWKPWYDRILKSLFDLKIKNPFMIAKEWFKDDKARDQQHRVKRYCEELRNYGLINGGKTSTPTTDLNAKFEYSLNREKFVDYWYSSNKRLFPIKELSPDTKGKLIKVFETDYMNLLQLIVKSRKEYRDDNVFSMVTIYFHLLGRYPNFRYDAKHPEEWKKLVLNQCKNNKELQEKMEESFKKYPDGPHPDGLIIKEGVDAFKENFTPNIPKQQYFF